MKKYDNYKDSGIEWIGEVPGHWEIKRIRHVADIYGRIGYRGYTVEDIIFEGEGAISLSPSNIENQKLSLREFTKITLEKYEESPEIKVCENDVILVKTASVGKATIVKPLKEKATINPQLVVFKNYKIDNLFFYYEIISRIIQDQISHDLNGGVVNTITQTNLNNYIIIVPPSTEQTAIAAYLDRKTAEIDTLIADKKRLLELYEEEKTVLINQAVTKGIDPDVKMKDSGVAWLGEVPEGWEVKKLRYVGNCQNGISKSGEHFGKGSPFVSYGDVYKNYELPLQVDGLVESTSDDRINYSVEKGDVFFTRTSETIEEIGIASTCIQTVTDAVFAGFLIRFRPKKNVLFEGFSKFFFRAQIHRRYFVKEMNLVTRASLSQEVLKKLPVVVPPLKEQHHIVHHIETESRRIAAKQDKVKKLIGLLTEYRTALVSEVVTGKVRVI